MQVWLAGFTIHSLGNSLYLTGTAHLTHESLDAEVFFKDPLQEKRIFLKARLLITGDLFESVNQGA